MKKSSFSEERFAYALLLADFGKCNSALMSEIEHNNLASKAQSCMKPNGRHLGVPQSKPALRELLPPCTEPPRDSALKPRYGERLATATLERRNRSTNDPQHVSRRQ